jgi:hypothetical protein
MSLCRPPALSKSDLAGKELADTYLGEDGIYDLTAKVKSSVSSSNDNNGVLHGLLQIGNNISSSPKISVLSASGNPPTGSAAKLPLQTQDGHNKDDQGVLKPGAGGGGQICVMSVSFEKLGCPEAAVWCSVPIEPNQLRFAMLTDFDVSPFIIFFCFFVRFNVFIIRRLCLVSLLWLQSIPPACPCIECQLQIQPSVIPNYCSHKRSQASLPKPILRRQSEC